MSQQETASGRIFVVKDPLSGGFFRFREVEQFIAQQFDGATPLEVVRQKTEARFGAALSEETLSAFIKTLGTTGLLETEATAKGKGANRRGRVRGSLLYLRFKMLDPAKLLDGLARRLRFLFTPPFLVFSAALILAAAAITIGQWSEVAHGSSQLLRLASIPLFLVVMFVVVSAHEFAHGLTCRHFGGEVQEMGFMLIYFQPAFYCNVSDAWLFPDKAKRLWVGFAGPYFELFVWALATLAWRLTDSETWINYLALMVMAGSGIKTLFNFNPFIKLDGYYLLSDYLEIPNLRKKSFRYVGGLIKRLFGAEPQAVGELSRRERRVYLTYGLLATVSSFCLMGYVIVRLGGYLLEAHQPALLLLLTTLVGTKFRRRYRRLFGKPGASSDPSDEGDDFETPVTAATSEPARPRKRRSRRWLRRLIWATLIAAAVAAANFGEMELRIAGQFTVLPTENADVRAAVEGIIERIYVDEGVKVKAGDIIARLSDTDRLADLRKTEAEIAEARANLRKLEAGPTPQEIAVANAAISKAEDQLRYAQSRLARGKAWFEGGILSRKQYDDLQEPVTMAEDDLVDAKARLSALLSSVRPEQIDATQAQIERLETHRDYVEEQLRLVKVVSPAAGIVATPSRQLKEMRRQLVKKGDLIAKVYEFETVTGHLLISEKEIADVRVGQKVILKARAYPGETFHGAVTSIATSAQGSSAGSTPFGASSPNNGGGANKSILVTTQIDNPALLLKPEMTGQAKILCSQRRIRDLLQRRLARTFRVEFWSWW